MELKICHLYPDVLGLTGDHGNLMCLVKRLAWRGIDVSVTEVKMGESLHAADFDLFFLGGGEDFDHAAVAEDLRTGKAAEICAAVEEGKTFLAICGGYQILGKDSGNMCDVYICKLRSKLSSVSNEKVIFTVRNKGYMLKLK